MILKKMDDFEKNQHVKSGIKSVGHTNDLLTSRHVMHQFWPFFGEGSKWQ